MSPPFEIIVVWESLHRELFYHEARFELPVVAELQRMVESVRREFRLFDASRCRYSVPAFRRKVHRRPRIRGVRRG